MLIEYLAIKVNDILIIYSSTSMKHIPRQEGHSLAAQMMNTLYRRIYEIMNFQINSQ